MSAATDSTNSALDHIHNVVAENAYDKGYDEGFKAGYKRGLRAAERSILKWNLLPSCDNCANCPKTAGIKTGGVYPVCTFWPDCVRNGFRNWRKKEESNVQTTN